MRIIKNLLNLFLLFFVFSYISSSFAYAQDLKSYMYNYVNVNAYINKDSTISVEDTESFNFLGNYHYATRDLSLNGLNAITDIEVIDDSTKLPLQLTSYTSSPDYITEEGKYFSYTSGGELHIKWFYNLANTSHVWTIKYKLHGGIQFNKNFDGIYWNIFTNFPTSISQSIVNVTLPSEKAITNVQYNAFRTNGAGIVKTYSNNRYSYTTSDISPNESFTIQASWPKGIVDQNAFWKDFFSIYYGYILGLIIILLGLISGFIYWYLNEYLKINKSKIIPQYEPPQKLRPGIAEVILRRSFSEKGLSATIVDLAIRGVIKIKEESTSKFYSKISGFIKIIMKSCMTIAITIGVYVALVLNGYASIYILIIIVPIIAYFVFTKINLSQAKYGLELVDENFKSNATLEDYEKLMLSILFKDGKYFSPSSLKLASNSTKRYFHNQIETLKSAVYDEAEVDTNAFISKFSKNIGVSASMGTFISVILVVIFVFPSAVSSFSTHQSLILLGALLVTIIGLGIFIFARPKLTQNGIKLTEEWLGFKLYLMTAEKLRLQNLTPEIFEKYLPYAMVLGVEKQWARNFRNINIPAPTWYTPILFYGGTGSVSPSQIGNSFNPSIFSSSFTSSMSSIFTTAPSQSGSGFSGGFAGGGFGGGGGSAG